MHNLIEYILLRGSNHKDASDNQNRNVFSVRGQGPTNVDAYSNQSMSNTIDKYIYIYMFFKYFKHKSRSYFAFE